MIKSTTCVGVPIKFTKLILLPSTSVLRGGGFGLGHLLKDGSNFFLFVITFPEIVQSEDVFGNFLDFIHVDSKL